MFGLFKRNKQKKKSTVQFVDVDGNPLNEGDTVLSLRYDLGKCIIRSGENGFEYQSIESQKTVSWALMIDAATERQKVQKVEE